MPSILTFDAHLDSGRMPEEPQRPPNTNPHREALRRLETPKQRLLGAREAVRWQREFIAQWKKEGLDTAAAAAEQLLPHLERRLRAIERECGTLREELGTRLDEVTKPPSAKPVTTVRAVGIRVET
jgi:hypothetical protein